MATGVNTETEGAVGQPLGVNSLDNDGDQLTVLLLLGGSTEVLILELSFKLIISG